MRQWTTSEVKSYLRSLEENDTHDLAMSLCLVTETDRRPQPQPVPTGNEMIVSYLEQLVEDRRACVVDRITPYKFGEMRWLAARALACEYAYLGIENPIILEDVVQPMRRSEAAGINPYKTIHDLIRQRLLPTKTEIILPQDYVDCCSKESVEERKRNQDQNK